MYNKLKWFGALSWVLTYVFWMILAWDGVLMIPLLICCYNVSYEIMYSLTAKSKQQFARNFLWLIFDSLFIIAHMNISSTDWFFEVFVSFLIAQVVLSLILSKEVVKSFAWFSTFLMSVLIFSIPTYSQELVFVSMVFKTMGDGGYGLAHLLYGVPGIKPGKYNNLLRVLIFITSALNIAVLIKVF